MSDLWAQSRTGRSSTKLPRTARRAVNSAFMLALRLGLPVPPYSRANAIIVETVGRHSGRPRRNPVGCIQVDDKIVAVAEHGAQADWVRNALARDGHLRVFYRGEWHEARLRLLDEDPETYLQRMNRKHAAFVRRLAKDPRPLEITLNQE